MRLVLKTDIEIGDWRRGLRGSFFTVSIFVFLKFSANTFECIANSKINFKRVPDRWDSKCKSSLRHRFDMFWNQKGPL